MNPLNLLNLSVLMERTCGRPEIRVALIDGPVALSHPDLATENVHTLGAARCAQASSFACRHGTFVAGILFARRGSAAPALCPGCSVFVRPAFVETTKAGPSATPDALAAAIRDCLDAGARVLNLSLALAHPSLNGERALEQALDQAARCGALVVAAAGNQRTIGSSAITRHPGVIPVAACDLDGRPLDQSNLAASIGRRGLSAPGRDVVSLGPPGRLLALRGTSVSVPLVTGTLALLWSLFPAASATQIRLAVACPSVRRTSIVPPLLDAQTAYRALRFAQGSGFQAACRYQSHRWP